MLRYPDKQYVYIMLGYLAIDDRNNST